MLARCYLVPAALVMGTVPACSGDGSGGPAGPSGPDVTVSGVLQDSAAARPIPHVVVSVGGLPAGTNRLGSYSVVVPQGRTTIRTDLERYEPFSRTLELTGDTTVDIPLRRLPPLMKDLKVSSDGTTITATIVDLQGAGTILRDERSGLIIHGTDAGGQFYQNVVEATNWTWQRRDDHTWKVTVRQPSGAVTYLGWALMDDSRNGAVFDCRLPAGGCTEL